LPFTLHHLPLILIASHLGSMFNNVINAWWPLLFYSAADAPRFTKGTITLICVSVATLFVTFVVWALERREKRRVGVGLGDRVDEGESRRLETEVASEVKGNQGQVSRFREGLRSEEDDEQRGSNSGESGRDLEKDLKERESDV